MHTLVKATPALIALAILCAASAAGAFGEAAGSNFTRYYVDLGAKDSGGNPMYSTFTAPGTGSVVPYEAVSVHATSSVGACWQLAATTLNSVDLKMWIESTPGNWVSLADDIINGTDPATFVYTASTGGNVIRVANYHSGTAGKFMMVMQPQVYPNETPLQTCDRFANGSAYSYARVDASGNVTFVRRQGSP